MIFVDGKGHMISDLSEDELHSFAKKIGLLRDWFQSPPQVKYPHYDLTTQRKINYALRMGAYLANTREMIKMLRTRLGA